MQQTKWQPGKHSSQPGFLASRQEALRHPCTICKIASANNSQRILQAFPIRYVSKLYFLTGVKRSGADCAGRRLNCVNRTAVGVRSFESL
jgi:hypothetical protein